MRYAFAACANLQTFVDVADERVDLAVPRRCRGCTQCGIERLLQLAGRRQRSRETGTALSPSQVSDRRWRVLLLRFVEETADHNASACNVRASGSSPATLTSSSASCRARMNSATLSAVRTVPLRAASASFGSSVLVAAVKASSASLVTRLVVEQSAELELKIRVAADVRIHCEGASNEEGCRAGRSLNDSHEPRDIRMVPPFALNGAAAAHRR